MLRERARVDRGLRCFSLVVFTPKHLHDDNDLRLVAHILRDRVRTSDFLGFVDAGQIGVLLTDTDGEGAWIFTDGVRERFAEAELAVDSEVYVYPQDWKQFGSGGHKAPLHKSAPSHRLDGSASENGSGNGFPHRKVDMVASNPFGGIERLADLRLPPSDRAVGDLTHAFVLPIPWWKRLTDILVSGSMLLVLSPLLALIAAAIKLTSPGPVIFRQRRAGVGGRPFDFFKFRSMTVDAEEQKEELRTKNEQRGPIFKIRQDPRVTGLGRLLRRTSLDELPQLWNVLRGDMSLVGPRPPTLDEVPNYKPWQLRRLFLTGGLTCSWQVSGRSEIGFEDWVRMDIRYAANRSFMNDLRLIARTPAAMVTGRGAY